MSSPGQDTVVVCRCHAQYSIGGICPSCGDTISIENDEPRRNSPPSENLTGLQSEGQHIDPPGPLIGSNDDDPTPMDQSCSSQDDSNMLESNFTLVSEMSESYVNISEEPSLTPYLPHDQVNTTASDTSEAPQELRPPLVDNVNPQQMTNPADYGNSYSPHQTQNMQNPNMMGPPVNQPQMPYPNMQQGYPQYYNQPQCGYSNFNQINQNTQTGQLPTHSDFNQHHGQTQEPASYNPQTPSGEPRGPVGMVPNYNQQIPVPGYPFNPMMNPGMMASSYAMPSMPSTFPQGGPRLHTPNSQSDSPMSQSTDSSFTSTSSSNMYGQPSMMGSQMMMQPLMMIMQKIFHYQTISQERALSDFEKFDYDQSVRYSTQLMQQSLSMMGTGGVPMGSSHMYAPPPSQSMHGGQMFDSQNQMSQSMSGLPNPMLNSQLPSSSQPQASDPQPERVAQPQSISQPEPSIASQHPATVKTEPSGPQPDITPSVSVHAERLADKSDRDGVLSLPKPHELKDQQTKSSEQASEFHTPPQSPRTLHPEIEDSVRFREGVEESADQPVSAGDLLDAQHSRSETNPSIISDDQSNPAQTKKQQNPADGQSVIKKAKIEEVPEPCDGSRETPKSGQKSGEVGDTLHQLESDHPETLNNQSTRNPSLRQINDNSGNIPINQSMFGSVANTSWLARGQRKRTTAPGDSGGLDTDEGSSVDALPAHTDEDVRKNIEPFEENSNMDVDPTHDPGHGTQTNSIAGSGSSAQEPMTGVDGSRSTQAPENIVQHKSFSVGDIKNNIPLNPDERPGDRMADLSIADGNNASSSVDTTPPDDDNDDDGDDDNDDDDEYDDKDDDDPDEMNNEEDVEENSSMGVDSTNDGKHGAEAHTTSDDPDVIHEKLYQLACQLVNDVAEVVSNRDRKSPFQAPEEAYISKTRGGIFKKNKEREILKKQIQRESEKENRNEEEKKRLQSKIDDLRRLHLNFFQKNFKEFNQLYAKIDRKASRENEKWYACWNIVDRAKKAQKTGKLKRQPGNKSNQMSASNPSGSQAEKPTKFIVYIANNFGEVRNVSLVISNPARREIDCHPTSMERVWTAEVNLFQPNRRHQYKYRIQDDKGKLIWEYINTAVQSRYSYGSNITIKDRFVVPNEWRGSVVYDGAALPEHKKQDGGMLQRAKAQIKSFFSLGEWREQEMYLGYSAMAPVDVSLFQERTASEVCSILDNVYRQVNRIYEKTAAFNHCLKGYITDLYEWLKQYVTEEKREWRILVSSLIALLWLWTYHRESVQIKDIWETMVYTHLSLISINEFHTITLEQLSEALGTFKKEDLRELIEALSQESYSHSDYFYNNRDYTWFILTPLLHAVAINDLKKDVPKGHNSTIWWGELDYLKQFKDSLKSASVEFKGRGQRFHVWYRYLQPYFKMDMWAPRTFLAHLSTRALVKMMEPEHPLMDFPLDAFCACFSYHAPTSTDGAYNQFWNNLEAIVNHGIKAVDEQDDEMRFVTCRTALASLHEALVKYSRYDSAPNKQAMFHTIRSYLTVLNYLREQFSQSEEKRDYFFCISTEAEDSAVRYVHRSYDRGLDKQRTGVWERLLQCCDELLIIKQWWTTYVIIQFKRELDETSKNNLYSDTIMDRYLDSDSRDKRISAVLLEFAIKNAQDLLKKNIHLRYKAEEEVWKISQIIAHAVEQTWAGIDDRRGSPIEIVTNILEWKNFVTLHDFIKTVKDASLPEETHVHMKQAITALQDVVERLKHGCVTRNEVAALRHHVEDLVETCKCEDEYLSREKDSIHKNMHAVEELIRKYDTFKAAIGSLMSKCSKNLSDNAPEILARISTWLERMENETPISNLFDDNKEVVNPDITLEFRQIASELEEKQKSNIFCHYLNEDLKSLKASSLEDVVESFRKADHQHEELLAQIREGEITAGRMRRDKNMMFKKSLDRMTAELSKSGISNERIAQIKICEQFETHKRGAQTILQLRDELELTGDFDVLNIFTMKLSEIRLNEISQQIVDGIKVLGRNISGEEINCLTVIGRHSDFVKWAHDHVPDNEIRTFIDLAHNNIGENDDTARKIDALMDALNGYSPMIYEMKSETDFKHFMDIAEKVWTAFRANTKLPNQLAIAAAELELWKDLKENLNNFEIDVLSQASSINETGVFKIGAIRERHTDSYLELNDIIELDCKLKRRVIANNTTNESEAAQYSAKRFDSRTETRFKGFKGSLEELQEKLTLIAGEKQRENEDTIDKFDKLRDVVTKLGQACLDLQREGCILFDDLLIIIHCSATEEIPIELIFAGVEQPLRTMNQDKSVIQVANELHRFMVECMTEWETNLDDARKNHRILNHYTTEQLVTLRKELAKLFQAAPGEFHEVLQLVRAVAPVAKERLFQLGLLYKNANNANTQQMLDQPEVDDDEVQDVVDEIMGADDQVEENQCLYAVRILGTKKRIDEYIEYINQMEVTSQNTTISSEIFLPSTTTLSMMDQLNQAWNRFLEMTASTHEKLLSIDQLVFTLNELLPQDKGRVCRKRPDWLESNKPTLLVCDKSKMLQLVLSVYMEDMDADEPNRSHILICTKLTTVEEVKIFMLRALSDSDSVYCMVNCERLDNSKCRVIEEQIYQSKDHREDGYTICFFCDEAVRDARIRSYLSKYSVHNIDMIKGDVAERCKHYIQTKILSGENVPDSARSVDNGLACRVIRSDLAGVGKTLHCTRIREQKQGANYVIIPIYRKLDIDAIISQLYERCKPEPAYNIIHIDISYEVESGVDDILMNLIVLGSICSSRGVVWHRNERDYYLIESMPFRKNGENVHYLLDLMPEFLCTPPTNERNQLLHDTSLDSQILASPQWQIVLKFLQKFEAGDVKYKLQPEAVTRKADAMKLIVKNCGLHRPSWSELTYFVNFLSSQLMKVETSPYCSSDDTSNPTGFKKFVVEFMRIMAQDFATRSLKISEESPGLTLNELEDRAGRGGMLDMLSVKRSWESANHPYLFFNEDSNSFSFIGFVLSDGIVDRDCHIVDPETKQRIENYPAFPRQLKNDLERVYKVNLSQPFNEYSKEEKLDKMQQIMVADPHLYRGNSNRITDPDPNYELTLDNVKKILAIHQRIRVGIPVIVMGDTGCGKTKLIDYASKLQIPEGLRQRGDGSDDDEGRITNMITVKVHGGTTEDDIIHYVTEAQVVARENQNKCEAYARGRGWVRKDGSLYNVPSVYTVLFLDEANTTEAIGLVKEILCDRRILGVPLDLSSGLKIVAACNPYRKHNDRMIKKLREAGLGYFVGESETTDTFAGQIPMRHLVYRVQALSQSLLPLVWDFGTLKNDVEKQYITQMITQAKHRDLDFGDKSTVIAQIISDTHAFMRNQKDECSFVSLRDVNRLLEITRWFQQISPDLLPLMKEKTREDDDFHILDDDSDAELDDEQDYMSNEVANSLLLAIGVCYLARLEEKTRKRYAEVISRPIGHLLDSEYNQETLPDGAEYFNNLIRRCQDVMIDEVTQEVTQEGLEDRGKAKHTNIAKNKALKENVFMMIVCIENRIPLFLVGKPGSSKSLSKAMVFDALVGRKARSQLIQQFKQTYMVSFQCSRLATPNSIVSVFHEGAKRQQNRDINDFVSIIVLDEVGLAEDSENMPLKALHPLLEDGCEGHEKPEPWKKCAFVGISNWALDPAKMNRGIFVQRGTPEDIELIDIARGICKGVDSKVLDDVNQVLRYLVNGYLAVCKAHKPADRKLTEFFGLRDFYSLVKMVLRFAQFTGHLYKSQIIHAIKRNFGGFDPQSVDCLKEFTSNFPMLENWPESEEHRPPTEPMDLVKCSITNDVEALHEIESRYLLVLTENLSILSLILDKFASTSANSPNYKPPEIIFGSYFKRDIHFTQVCHNINLIKNCMASGTPVILLNLDDLYESLYDTLNQYFSTLGDTRFVGLGLGTHRVKAFVHNDFRLVVIADSGKVYRDFPIPLINRLEKHYISMNTLLNEQQREVKKRLERWAERFKTPTPQLRKQADMKCVCGIEMYEPYLLPCRVHHIGVCCRDRIMVGQLPRECPRCHRNGDTEPIPNEWEWEVDGLAKESRDYFERSIQLDTNFIGYSNEMVALIVIQSTPDDGYDTSSDQILENAKKQLLQVATADSVLRVEKTTLYTEKEWVQKTYFQEQNHENLYSYLDEAIRQKQNHLKDDEQYTGLFIQVTTFARLLTSMDMDDIQEKMTQDEPSFTKECCTINDFDTEAEFTDKLRKFYSECHKYQNCLLVLQCESAHMKLELLDSVRYLVFRESKNIQPTDLENHKVITVLILNLPRGIPLSCYQGQPWKCVHIDDPSCSNLKTPSLLQCLKMKPSEIIEHVTHNTKVRAGLVEAPQTAACGDMQQSTISDSGISVLSQSPSQAPSSIHPINRMHVNTDDDMMSGIDVIDEPEPESIVYRTSVSVESIIVPALPKVLSAIDGHDKLSYKIIRDNILRNNADSSNITLSVVIVWLEYTQSLLKESEQKNTRYNWVTSNAAKAVIMKRNETVRSSLETSLHAEIRPALAAVIAQCEPYNNLNLLSDDSITKRKFWLELMKACFTTKLNFSDIATPDEKLPERFKVGGNQGGRRFDCRFPFSWTVFEIINEMLNRHSTHEAERLFVETPVGRVIAKYFEINTRSEGSFKDWSFDRYISDFIHLSHPCHSDQEHELVCRSLLAMMRRLTDEGHHFNSLVSIHDSFNRCSEHYSKLSIIINVTLRWNIPVNKQGTPLWSAVCSELLRKQDDLSRYPCHLLVLMKTMKLVQSISMRDFKQDFIGYVSMISSLDGLFKDYVLQMLDEDDEGMRFIPYEFEELFEQMRTECLIIRHQLILKKNYVQHVVLKLNPGVTDHNKIQTDQLSNISRACNGLTEFKKFDSFNKVVKALEDSLVQQTCKVFRCEKKCPRCTKAMISPVRLPCSHLVCMACTESLNWLCPHEGCRQTITEAVNYNPEGDHLLNKGDVAALEIHRTYLNEFFMMFVSDVVFHPEFENSQHKEPSKEVIEYLVGCITSQNGTRKFSIFNARDVIDQKSPVVRTFLLKLLLHVALREDDDDDSDREQDAEHTEYVAANKLIEFVNRPTHKSYAELRAQTIALLIDCIKDHLEDAYEFVDYNSPNNTREDIITPFEDADWFDQVQTLSLNHLQRTAYTQITLERAVLHLLSTEKQNPDLIMYLKRYLDHMETVSEQPKLFICRLINDQYGEGKIMDIEHNEELSFLLPQCIHRALIQFKVEDHLAIEADESYKTVIGIIDRVLTIRDEQLEEATNQLKQVTNISVLLHALFTRVTRFFTTQHPPNENRIHQIRQLLQRKFTQHHASQRWFEAILTNDVLGGILPLESSEGAQISMLVLRTFTTLREGQGLLAPLTNILNNVISGRTVFLPTMPDNPIEEIQATVSSVLDVTKAFECPNGHVYYIGNCGGPVATGKCNICGAVIGGTGYKSAQGNTLVQDMQQYKTLPGYLNDAAIREPIAERDLSVLSLTVMRCLLHVCLLTAAATNQEQVNTVIGKGAGSITHLINRIKTDVKHLSKSLNTNHERIMILLHLALHGMTQLNMGGQYNLADKTSRRTWEKAFDDNIIKPTFNQNAVNTAERQQELISDNTGDMRDIIPPKPDLIQDNMLDCSYMWIYKRPLNLEVIRKTVSSQQDTLLKKFLDQGTRLQLVCNLPEIATLIKKLSVKLDNKFTQEQSESTDIESFLSEYDEFRELVNRYINVWNNYTKFHNDAQTDESARILPITYQSSLLEILPITVSPDNANGSTYRRILYYLIETHNSFIHQSQRTDEGIDISLVTQSHLVCLPGGSEELVPIVIRHSQYEFGESFERTCDWGKIDEEIGYQYITGRRPINTESINKLPAYHFPNEFTIITLINKLRDQELVIRGDKDTVMQRLSGYGVNQLNGILTQLETMVKICSSIRQYDNTEKLHSAIQRNFDEEPDWLMTSLEVRHLVSLWTVIKFLQAKAFKKNQQLAFDEIVGECKKDLDDCYKVEMKERMASYQSYQTHLLLEHLFEFILFRLNNVTARHEDLLFNQPLSDCMDQYINGEVYEDLEEGEGFGRLNVEDSEPIPVSQATSVWEYLYVLYSTPIETELTQ